MANLSHMEYQDSLTNNVNKLAKIPRIMKML